MTVEQIQRFVEESVAVGYRWEHLIVSGGEPTMHKDFFTILNILRGYRDAHSPSTRIHVTTDGTGNRVKQAIAQIPDDIDVINSNKDGKRQAELHHTSFNVAAEEIPAYRNADFRNACDVVRGCGTGLGPSGYYHCPVAAGMDRIFGWDIGRKSLPLENDSMEDLAERFCGKCGHFMREMKYKRALDKPLISATWERAYAAYRDRSKEELVVLQPASALNAQQPKKSH
jgi:hypothetical protein